MNRKTIISIHLFLASFFTPILIMIAVSGGLYLLGSKGEVTSNIVYEGEASEFDSGDQDSKAAITRLLKSAGIAHSFDYVKSSGSNYFTRPTSREYYVVSLQNDRLQITHNQPDFIKSIVELHKGHGPSWFKTFQKLVALGLLLILISGFCLALTSPMLRKNALIVSGVGTLLALSLAFI